MADISDVEQALCEAVTCAVYPNGVSGGSAIGLTVKVYRGFPNNTALALDIAAQNQTVTVLGDQKGTRNTTRYPQIWRTLSYTTATLTVIVSDTVCEFAGQAGTGQVIGLEVDRVGYAYAPTSTDSIATIMTALASLVPGGISTPNSVSFPFAMAVTCRISGTATSVMETRRQEQKLSVHLWCSTPAARDALANAVDSYLATIDWLNLADGTAARLIYESTIEQDDAADANVYRRNLVYTVEYPTVLISTSAEMLFPIGILTDASGSVGFGDMLPPAPVTLPRLGAIRFDAWYDPNNPIDAQCAAALSPALFQDRLPPNADLVDNIVSWPLATQATIDAEIAAACAAGLAFWAFDSYDASNTLSLALQLYLSSSIRAKLGFCMVGQISNWGSAGQDQPVMARDVALMSQPGYVTVLGGRPLYFVLDASAQQEAGLPNGSASEAIGVIRQTAIAAGVGDPYIVWLSGAPLASYDNVVTAQSVGADAAGSYATPLLNGATQAYSALTQTTEADWAARAALGFPMVATAMCGWDQRPLIETPQAFYPIDAGLTMQNYYQMGTSAQIAEHIASLAEFVLGQPTASPAQIGLVYAWNEFAEGGWLAPTWTAGGSNLERTALTGAALSACAAAVAMPQTTLF